MKNKPGSTSTSSKHSTLSSATTSTLHHMTRQQMQSNSKMTTQNQLSARELHAAATLQAATRGMLARKSFSSIRKQTMASLVIQKSLVKWWNNKPLSNNSNKPSFEE